MNISPGTLIAFFAVILRINHHFGLAPVVEKDAQGQFRSAHEKIRAAVAIFVIDIFDVEIFIIQLDDAIEPDLITKDRLNLLVEPA